jgi:glucose/arabinose dehydrogenase
MKPSLFLSRQRTSLWRLRTFVLTFGILFAIASCGGGGGGGGGSGDTAAAGPAPAGSSGGASAQAAAASVVRPLEVPTALAADTFSDEKKLTVPPGFGIRLWARVPHARFMALAPNGDVLVSVPDDGRIVLLRPRANDVPQQFEFAGGLRKPHDMVFHQIGNVTYLYVSESNRITRSVYHSGDTQSTSRDVVVDNLPDSSSPELGGAYGHELKNIAFGPGDKLYVSIGSNCNACAEDTVASPVRGAIYQYDADGGNGRLFARGLRNAEGLDFIPGTNTLWAAVNNRDEITVPLDEDVDGDGVSDLGKVVPAYTDANPAELFTQVRDGGNYGWPFCNAVPNAAMSKLDSLPDYLLNRNGQQLDCATIDRPDKGIRAHSAPLGLSFLQNSNMPAAYRNGAVIALHGCWNCTSLRAGFKVVYFPFSGSSAGSEEDLVTGFVTDPDNRSFWGRPVDAIADASGNLLISDDFAGAVYQLYPLP